MIYAQLERWVLNDKQEEAIRSFLWVKCPWTSKIGPIQHAVARNQCAVSHPGWRVVALQDVDPFLLQR